MKLYVNGTKDLNERTISGNLTSTTYKLILGSIRESSPLNGTIDEVKIWDRALSQEEILAEYNNEGCTIKGDST